MRLASGILSACVLVSICGLAAGQDKPVAPVQKETAPAANTSPAGEGAVLVFEKQVHDFGVISDDKNVQFAFRFTNNGKTDLEIKSTQASCGCTVPALSKRIYKPGESGEITVEYHPQGKRGSQHTRVTVTSNDIAKPSLELEVKSEVRPLLQVDPILVNVGQIVKGQGGKATAKIVSRVPNLKPEAATPNNVNLEAKLGEGKEFEQNGEKAMEWPVEISVPTTAPVGQLQANVAIKTNDPSRLLNLTVMGEIMGDVTVNPPRVTLQALSAGQEINTQFRLTSRTGKAFQVTKVVEEPAPGMAKCFGDIKVTQDTATTPPSYLVTLTGRAPDKGGAVRGDVVVHTDISDEDKIRVQYFGFVKAEQAKARSIWDEQPSSLIPTGPR